MMRDFQQISAPPGGRLSEAAPPPLRRRGLPRPAPDNACAAGAPSSRVGLFGARPRVLCIGLLGARPRVTLRCRPTSPLARPFEHIADERRVRELEQLGSP